VDAHGNLIYAAGDGLSVRTLADLLRRAGAVRAMELDINHDWVTFNFFSHPQANNPADVVGQKLLSGMHKPSSRYLSPDSRDFVEVLAR
jgi:hypothetical protein